MLLVVCLVEAILLINSALGKKVWQKALVVIVDTVMDLLVHMHLV